MVYSLNVATLEMSSDDNDDSGTKIPSQPVRLFPFKNFTFFHQPKTGSYEIPLSSQIPVKRCTRCFESTLPEIDPKGHLSRGDCAHGTGIHCTESSDLPVLEWNKISFRRLSLRMGARFPGQTPFLLGCSANYSGESD